MGRKKKIVTVEKETEEQLQITSNVATDMADDAANSTAENVVAPVESALNNASKISQALPYVGKIKVELRQGNRVIQRREHYNHGGNMLFKLITAAIGRSINESGFRPTKLRLIGHIDGSTALQYFSNSVAWNSTPDYSSSTEEPVSITLKFLVPYLQMIIPAAGGIISAFILLPDSGNAPAEAELANVVEGSNLENYCALADLTGNELGPISPQDIHKNYNVYVEWTLSFKNPQSSAPVSA